MVNAGFADKPVDSLVEEKLDVKDYMEALSGFVLTCETPMVINIQSDWGTGKTSMMNLVKGRLEEENIETIWFNAWQFSLFNMGDNLSISLLAQVEKQFDISDAHIKSKMLTGAKTLAKIGSSQLGMDESYDPVVSSNMIVELKEKLNKAATAKIANTSGDRIVIFIDDLDRLAPEKAVELLETIKLFLDIPGSVFILAIDYSVVKQGLEDKFGTSVDDIKAKSFFDKIIQLSFSLPVTQYDIGKYFKELLQDKFDYDEADIEILVRLVNSSVGFNPRDMKRLFNALQLLRMVAASKKMLDGDSIATAQEKQRMLFAILCLQTEYQSMYCLMLRHRSKIDQKFFDSFSSSEKLQQSDYYDEVKKEFTIEDDERNTLVKFIEFIKIFYKAIQFKSDDSEDSDKNLSDKELENLIRFLSLSSITASGIGNRCS